MARDELDDALLAAMRAIMRISLHAADEIGTVSVVQLRALTVLDAAGELNLARLADGVGVTASTTSRLVDRLIAAGLVQRDRASHTAREVTIRLTPLGRSTLDRYDQLRLDELRGSTDGLAAEERDVVRKALQAIAARAPVEVRDSDDGAASSG